MRKLQLLSLILVLGLLLAACGPQAAPVAQPPSPTPVATPTGTGPAPAPAVPAKPAWEEEWQKTLAAANKEGKIVVASSLSGEARTAVMQGFQKAYGIPQESISARSAEIAEKILRERRAGLYNYDVFIIGSTTALNQMKPAGALAPIDPALILPDVTDPELIKKTWYPGKLWYVDADHTSLACTLTIILPIAVNTNLVKDGDIKSYKDLLGTKWQGKTVMNDPTTAGTGPAYVAFVEAVLGWDYVVEFSKTKPVISRDNRQMTEWLAQGKYAVLVGAQPDVIAEFKRIGAPVKGIIPSEGTWMLSSNTTLSLLNRPPHPNATKVFVNWYLSKEGQTVIGPPAGKQSSRVDTPTDHLSPEQVRQPGVNYFIEEDEKLQLSQPDRMKRAGELFTAR